MPDNVKHGKRAIDLFPLASPRKSQEVVIDVVQKAFDDGAKILLLESPVGSGKSAIGLSLARYFGSSHILTPKKSLQNQYMEDFSDLAVLMKGRSSYPCVAGNSGYVDSNARSVYHGYVNDITLGKVIHMDSWQRSTSQGRCKGSKTIESRCTENGKFPCPYHVAIGVAQSNEHIIHNVYSFIYQANFGKWFQQRPLMLVDECHTLEDIVRGLSVVSVRIEKDIRSILREMPHVSAKTSIWVDFLSRTDVAPKEPPEFSSAKQQEEYTAYFNALDALNRMSAYTDMSIEIHKHDEGVGDRYKIQFTPIKLGNSATSYLFEYGERSMLMSGTIYDKNIFCRQLGINPEDVFFLRTGSSFPAKDRPIYLKKEYLVSTKHADWEANLPVMAEKIRKILSVFHDVKGLIHAPSYYAARQIVEVVNDPRLMTHDKDTFLGSLDEFYASKGNEVFVSPVCYEGVDFKGDRARFQIILRIPYLNAGDPFVEHMIKNNFQWYNYKALVTFGQQLGRVNRFQGDFGATILMDDRFPSFINKNRSLLPSWVHEAIKR